MKLTKTIAVIPGYWARKSDKLEFDRLIDQSSRRETGTAWKRLVAFHGRAWSQNNVELVPTKERNGELQTYVLWQYGFGVG